MSSHMVANCFLPLLVCLNSLYNYQADDDVTLQVYWKYDQDGFDA